MSRVALTKREARTVAKEIAHQWIEASINLGWLYTAVEKRFPDKSLDEQMKLYGRLEEALDELGNRLDPKETT
jgi:hypothetical protein